MKDTNFVIKVADFLAEKIYEDTIYFSDKFSTSLPHLIKWISCSIFIQWGGDKTILLTITNIVYSQKHSCDICLEDYTQESKLQDLYIKCYADYDEWLLAEDEIVFDSKHGQIDLEKIFVQEIILQQEIQKVCTKCKNNNTKEDSESVGTNNISRVFDNK